MNEGKTQQAAAAAAGMSVRSAREWQTGSLPSEGKENRSWRTRSDPFEGVWRSKIEPLLERDHKGKLEAKTLLEVLIAEEPERFSMGQVRTMQRRLRDWRALKGPTKEVYFPQEHPPGEQGALDFTCCNELDVTVGGQPLRHLLFEFVLVHSKWTWVCVAFSETFEALVDGLQRALWALGGVPTELLTDNLSAATHELKGGGGRALTRRFADVCDHLGFKQVRQINPGKSNENGAVEVRHRRTKKLLEQALVLRGFRDFDSVEAYELFAQETVDRTHNRHLDARLAEERALLSELPARRLPAYTTSTPKVRKWSTIQVRARIYSVPSQLIGHEVETRLYPNTVEVWYRGERVEVFPRMRGEGAHRIDYRHVIGSLVRKPGAFANYRFREDLFPTMAFRRAYDALRASHGERADIEYVRILKLAADTMESEVHTALVALLDAHTSFGYIDVEAQVRPLEPEIPVVSIPAPDLHGYNDLIGGAQ
jgi:transposase